MNENKDYYDSSINAYRLPGAQIHVTDTGKNLAVRDNKVIGEDASIALPEVSVAGSRPNTPWRAAQIQVEKDKNWRSAYGMTPDQDTFNAVTGGIFNQFSPSQLSRNIYNISTGNKNAAKEFVFGNNGIVTDKFAKENPEIALLGNTIFDSFSIGFPKINNRLQSTYNSNTPAGQYLRFIGGKFKYGFDAKLPDLIRRTQTPMPRLYQMRKNSPIVVSPIENRFRFKSTGQASPVITNFTTDLPVIPNEGGSWKGFDINIIKGNQLLGKNVISTKPMDTFTYGDKIKVPRRAIKTISSKQGTVPEEQLMQQFLREYKRPTLKDYQFMDYVFQPNYPSGVTPNIPLTINNSSSHPLGKYISNADMRSRLNQPWENVMYDIAPPVESIFRNNLGIVLRSELH